MKRSVFIKKGYYNRYSKIKNFVDIFERVKSVILKILRKSKMKRIVGAKKIKINQFTKDAQSKGNLVDG